MKSLSWLALVGGLAAACGDAPVSPVGDAATGPAGALLISAEVDDPAITRLHYAVRGPGLELPLEGELAVADGRAEAQLAIPAGLGRTVEVAYADAPRCNARARDLTIEAGRTAQVALFPDCAHDELAARRPPRIEAIYASRRSVEIGDVVALGVIASTPNGDPLTYRWTEQLAGRGFDAPSAPVTAWRAGPRSVARNQVTVAVSDGRSTASRSLTMDFDRIALGAGTCAQPTPIRIGQRLRGFTRGASNQASDTCGIPGVAPEHVFRLDLASRQDVSFTVTGSAFGARLYVRRGACGQGPELACEPGSQRIDLAQAEPGTYFIIVDGDSIFGQGEFQLTAFSGAQPEECRNFSDDDGDGAVDCADSDCADTAGCAVCAFECDPDPNDCVGGQCDPFSGRCNTFIRFGERCDRDADPATRDVCDGEGRCVADTAVCGNGIPEIGEQCDDGNTTDGDGCSATCVIVPVCGNGVPEFPEECDDGNTLAGDGCDPTCRVELCGSQRCDDGNPCTADVCTDAAAGTCQTAPVDDGTACDLDGSPATADTCQAGVCQAPPVDPALIVLDVDVLADPAFSLRAMHDRLAPDGDGAAQFAEWATTLTAPMTTNGRTVDGRPGFAAYLAGIPRDASGRFDVDAAGFLPSAMVNRFDLRTPGTCGENRLVFTKTSGATDRADRGTLIFEFAVPDDGSNCRNALAPWLALRGLTGEAKRAAAVAILEDFARPHLLNQFRTNEFVNAPFWELREFHLVDGHLQPFPVVDTVPFELAQDPTFRQFVVQNASALNHGAREIGILPTRFLAPASRADGTVLAINGLVPSLPGLEANLNILSCSGCHLTHTGTSFVHVEERPADRPSGLSTFMRSELEFRGEDLARFLSLEP